MGQTKAGAKKAAATIKAKYGTTPDGKSKLHVQIGAEGGKNGRGHTFGHGKVDPRVAGKIGGTKSRRLANPYKVGDKEYLI